MDGVAHYAVQLAREPGGQARHALLLLSAETMTPAGPPVDVGTIVQRLRTVLPNVPVTDAAKLEAYDAFYYGRGADAPPLPIARVKFGDPMETWAYIEPATGRIVQTVHQYSRLERWLFNGLHSLDFSFWYEHRPLWDIGVLTLMIGGLASSGIGLWVGAGRVRRAIGRRRNRS
jgi:hypothetical protein